MYYYSLAVRLFSVLCLRTYYLLLLFTCILPILSLSAVFANRLSSSVLTNRVWSVANRALNAFFDPSSAVVANHCRVLLLPIARQVLLLPIAR